MIGFYDSGVGGLTVLEQVLSLDPDFPFIYFADTAALPLGEKTIDFIQTRVKQACASLFDEGCEIVVLACNTASVNTIRHIQQVWLPQAYPGKQVLSVTKPLLELIEDENSEFKAKKGLLLATESTINSGFYQYELIKSGFSKVQSIACNGLADAIEMENSEKINILISEYISKNQIDQKEVDFLILACTHYKWAMTELKHFFPQAKIIEPSVAIAQKLILYINNHSEYLISTNLKPHFEVSGDRTSIVEKTSQLKIIGAINSLVL